MKMPPLSVKARIAAAALAAALAGGATLATAAAASADGVTPTQLTAAGWTCIRPHLFPALLLRAPPGTGLPPLPGTPGFADRAPSYEFLVFEFATGYARQSPPNWLICASQLTWPATAPAAPSRRSVALFAFG